MIRYPVVLDNNDATWKVYDQHYWPARHLIDADGFIRYQRSATSASARAPTRRPRRRSRISYPRETRS
jgi:hypothetical protein